MLAVTEAAVRDPDGPVIEPAADAGAVDDVIDPCAVALAVLIVKHADADVGVLALGDGGLGRGEELGTHPDCGVGVGGEFEATLDGGGVSGDGPGEVDVAGSSEGPDASVDWGRSEGWEGEGGWDRGGKGAGGEEGGRDKELGKHFGGGRLCGCVCVCVCVGCWCGDDGQSSGGRGDILYKRSGASSSSPRGYLRSIG